MKIDEMIKVMQHYDNGGWIVCSEDNFKSVLCEANKKDDGNLSWDWSTFDYRIKEQKQKVTIEKWLMLDSRGDYRIFESSDITNIYEYKPIKLLETYEVEI